MYNSGLELNSDIPKGWSRRLTKNGKPYFFNEITRETQWNRPDALSQEEQSDQGWVRSVKNGIRYFFNETSRETQLYTPERLSPEKTQLYSPEVQVLSPGEEEEEEEEEINEYTKEGIVSFTNKFLSLPTDLIIMSLETVLTIEPNHGWSTIESILNSRNFSLIMAALVAVDKKEAFGLMNTKLYLIVLSSMGYNFITNNSKKN
jgi:hypothetical protein